MFSKEEVTAKVEEVSANAKEILKARNVYAPTVFCFAEGKAFPLPLDDIMEMTEDCFEVGDNEMAYQIKRLMWAYVRHVIKNEQCFGVILAMEAWGRMLSEEETKTLPRDADGMPDLPEGSPRFSKDRQEVLAVTWEFKMMDNCKVAGSRQAVFHRNASRRISEIDAWTNMQDQGRGPAASFLP